MSRIVLLIAVLSLAVVTLTVTTYLLPSGATIEEPWQKPVATIDASVIVGPPKVKLAVLVVFDQLRGDYLARWKTHFPPGGFRRLMDDGGWYSNCYFPFSTTTTGPGHASIITGATLDKNGIVDNEWYDRGLGRKVYCAGSPRFETITTGTNPDFKKSLRSNKTQSSGGGTPERMLSPTVTDQLKVSGHGGKVIGISIKDRSAILPAGLYGDAAYWFTGEFVTSNYYLNELPDWVKRFNASHVAKRWYGKTWERLRPDLNYEAIAGPDNGPGEGDRAGLGVTFPHPVTGGEKKFTSKYYEALITTPFGSDLLLEFALQCVDEEKLGQREAVDFLSISFSSFDLVGHAFGPDSQEVFDSMLRADRQMAELLAALDAKIGAGHYSVLVTGDHGSTPLAEASAAKGIVARKVAPSKLLKDSEAFLQATYGQPVGDKATWIEASALPWIWLNNKQISARRLDKNEVVNAFANWLRTQPDMGRVYTAREIETQPPRDEIDRLMKNSFRAERCGDVYVILNPYCFFAPADYRGMLHGTPYEYDRHVPLVVYGPSGPKGERTEATSPQLAATILADHFGVRPPRDAIQEWPAHAAK